MVDLTYGGKATNLQDCLKDKHGGFEKAITAVLEQAGFGGTFTVTPHSIGRGSSVTKGVLRFGAKGMHGHGISCFYHPVNQDNGSNIGFTLSCVSDMDEISFLTKLKAAQSALLALKEKTMNAIPESEHLKVLDITGDQTSLSLVVSALRNQVSALGAEYLTAATVQECIAKTLACKAEDVSVYLNQLVDLRILNQLDKRGKLYTVSANKEGEAGAAVNAATDMANFLAELPKTIKRVTEIKAELPKLQADLKEKKISLDRCRRWIPELESEITNLDDQIQSATKFLNSDGVKAAIQFAELTKAIQV